MIDGAANGDAFLAYAAQTLWSTLKPADAMIMDNLRRLNVAGIREVIEAARANVPFLPPYGPGLNPIETVLAKLTALLRATVIRAMDALWNALGSLAECLTAEECRNHFRGCGQLRSDRNRSSQRTRNCSWRMHYSCQYRRGSFFHACRPCKDGPSNGRFCPYPSDEGQQQSSRPKSSRPCSNRLELLCIDPQRTARLTWTSQPLTGQTSFLRRPDNLRRRGQSKDTALQK